MRKVNLLIIVVLALSLIGAMVGCGEATPTPTATPTVTPTATPTVTPTATPVEPVRIGLLEDLTGVVGIYGVGRIEGEKTAIKMVNDAGGIKSLGGAKIEIVQGSGDSTVATSLSEVERLISSEKVVALAGPTMSGAILACIPLFERYRIPAINNLSDQAQFQKGYRYEFGVDPSIQLQGEKTADFIDWLAKNYGAPTDSIALCTLTPSYTGKLEGLIPRLAELGYKNIVLNETFPATVTDQSPLVMKLKAVNPDLVIYSGAVNDAIAFHKACYTYDYYPWMVCEGTAYGRASVRDGLPAEIVKKTLTRPNIFGIGLGVAAEALKDIDTIKAFRDLLAKEYPNSTSEYANVACAGAKILALIRAIENAGSRNPEDIANALRKVDIQAPDPYLVYGTLYPRFKMSDSGQVSTCNMMVDQWSDDLSKLQFCWPTEFATAEPRIQK